MGATHAALQHELDSDRSPTYTRWMTTNPHALFDEWLHQAEQSEPNDPNAVALATVGATGQPAVRMVLLKGHDARGFVIYTNQQSRKGDDLAATPRAALLFHWKTLRKQVRVEGAVSRVSDAEADAYFATRGRLSQLGAWASDQSRPLADRATLEARLADVTEQFAGIDVVRPPHWSGYRIAPERIEFWEDGANRLHDRHVFERADRDEAGSAATAEAGWQITRLYP